MAEAEAIIANPELPYARDALAEKGISEETLSFHYDKHHLGYVKKLNAALAGPAADQAGKSLMELVMTAEGGVYNNAAQIWNHSFYWDSMSPSGGGEPDGAIADAINDVWGSFDAFKAEFSATAAGHFGSGWAWLVVGSDGRLAIVGTHDAGNPLREGTGTPILTCDVWEHAYYIDFRNARPDYIAAWWNCANWEHANRCFAAATAGEAK